MEEVVPFKKKSEFHKQPKDIKIWFWRKTYGLHESLVEITGEERAVQRLKTLYAFNK